MVSFADTLCPNSVVTYIEAIAMFVYETFQTGIYMFKCMYNSSSVWSGQLVIYRVCLCVCV